MASPASTLLLKLSPTICNLQQIMNMSIKSHSEEFVSSLCRQVLLWMKPSNTSVIESTYIQDCPTLQKEINV